MAVIRTTDDSPTRKNLSKNVLQMKFMQRGGATRNDISPADRTVDDATHWYVGGIQKESQKFSYNFDVTYVDCENLLPVGRMSFCNFNPQVEKTHKEILHKAKAKLNPDEKEHDTISDDEMAHRYETLVGTIGKKFKRRKNNAKEAVNDDTCDESDEELKQLKKRAKRGFIKPKAD